MIGLDFFVSDHLLYEICAVDFAPDYPFDEDFETAVLRHADNRKWYAVAMKVSRRKFGGPCDEVIDVVNMKLPTEMILGHLLSRFHIPSAFSAFFRK